MELISQPMVGTVFECKRGGNYSLARVNTLGEGGEWETPPPFSRLTAILSDQGRK